MAITEKQIRMRLLAAAWQQNPKSKKIRRNVLTGERDKWAGKFTPDPTDENPNPEPFAFIIRRTAHIKNHMKGVDQDVYEVLVFKRRRLGTDVDNSEDEFQNIIDNYCNKIADEDGENPVWDFIDESLPEDEREKDTVETVSVVFGKIGLIDSSETLHFGGGRIVVNIFRC